MIRVVTFKMYDFIHSSTQVVLDELFESLRISFQNVHTLGFATGLRIPSGWDIETTFSAVSIISMQQLKSPRETLASLKSVDSRPRRHSSAGKEVILSEMVDKGSKERGESPGDHLIHG